MYFHIMLPMLQADMIVAIGKTLYGAIMDEGFGKEDILDCKVLTAYGIGCAAIGTFGVLKLNIDFERNKQWNLP